MGTNERGGSIETKSKGGIEWRQGEVAPQDINNPIVLNAGRGLGR